MKRLFVLSSPSGGGKSTVARYLMAKFPKMKFSVSATTRAPRPRETDGKEYYFMGKEEFQRMIDSNQMVEYEEIFGNYYGTLRSEIDKSFAQDKVLLFDIDVRGALSIKKAYPDDSLLVFLMPPNIEELANRLSRRHTESDEEVQRRLGRARMEIAQKDKFDYIVVNEILQITFETIEAIALKHLAL